MAYKSTGYPIPHRDLERENAVGHGPVIPYQMTPEELEEFRKRLGDQRPRNKYGELIKKSIGHPDKWLGGMKW
jgi:hypothetical protein